MAELLKLRYNEIFVHKLALKLKKYNHNFDINSFKNAIFNEKWDNLELKVRMHHITKQIHTHLPIAYKQQIEILNQVVSFFNGLTAMIFPNFVEQYGTNDYELSLKTLAFYTQFSTSEFAIRPFIINQPKATINQMVLWSKNENHHVRRLASEGCRPLLPWAMKLHELVKDPTPILPILENLKSDDEDYVYRSVANNLNDISKSHPELVIELCKKWQKGGHKQTQWVIKHALRTLLKKGDLEAMKIFGFGDVSGIKINNFKIEKTKMAIGESTYFKMEVCNASNSAKFRLEYSIYYLKNNGKHSPKVFQLKETTLQQNEIIKLRKKITFTDFTTRKHYKGQHYIEVKVNGIALQKIDFELI